MRAKYTYILRPQDKFNDFLKKYGLEHYEGIKNEPLYDYEIFKIDEGVLNAYDYFLITSEFALRALARTNIYKNKNLIIVGKNLHDKARGLADTKFEFIGQNMQEVQHFIETSSIELKKLVYLRGNYVTKSICGVDEYISYNVKYKDSLSNICLNDIRNGKVKTILFFSQNSIKVFLDIAHQENVNLKNIDAFSLTDKCNALLIQNFNKVIIATNADLDDLIKKLIKHLEL